MEIKQEDKTNIIISDRFQNILDNFAKCKIEFVQNKEECQKIQEINSRLETELREVRELEKSHRYQLLTSREMIGNLQETVSQLVYLKRDIKKLKDEIDSKDIAIVALEKDKESIIQKHNERLVVIQNSNDKQIDEIKEANERKIQQVQYESDTKLAQFTCVIEELRTKIKEMETEHRDKMSIVVLEYEEKIQRSAAQVHQLQDQLARQSARSDASIDAYRRRLEELEEKLKQNQFKRYLAQSNYSTAYESQVERPYVQRDPYGEGCSVYGDPINNVSKLKFATPPVHNKTPKAVLKAPNTLQVIYDNKPASEQKTAEKKEQFSVSKKRKLYSENNFLDF